MKNAIQKSKRIDIYKTYDLGQGRGGKRQNAANDISSREQNNNKNALLIHQFEMNEDEEDQQDSKKNISHLVNIIQ